MLTKFTGDLDIIAALDDEPNDVGGLTAAQLKAKFDAGPKALASYINETLTEELDAVTLPAEGTGVLEKTDDGVAWAPRRVTSWGSGYGIDCWKRQGGTPEVGASGLIMANLAQVVQFIPVARLQKGGTYTFSVKLAADVPHVASGWTRKASVRFRGYQTAYSVADIATINPEQAGVVSVTFTLPDTEYAYAYGVLIDAGKNYLDGGSMIVESVKLERNGGSTLALDLPPEPAAELLRCQTSFQVFVNPAFCPTSRLDFRPVMDAEPTVGTLTIDGVTCTTASCEL